MLTKDMSRLKDGGLPLLTVERYKPAGRRSDKIGRFFLLAACIILAICWKIYS